MLFKKKKNNEEEWINVWMSTWREGARGQPVSVKKQGPRFKTSQDFAVGQTSERRVIGSQERRACHSLLEVKGTDCGSGKGRVFQANHTVT